MLLRDLADHNFASAFDAVGNTDVIVTFDRCNVIEFRAR